MQQTINDKLQTHIQRLHSLSKFVQTLQTYVSKKCSQRICSQSFVSFVLEKNAPLISTSSVTHTCTCLLGTLTGQRLSILKETKITQDTEHDEKIPLAFKFILLSRKVTMANTISFPTDCKFMTCFQGKYRRCFLYDLIIVKVGSICQLANSKSCFTHIFVYLCSIASNQFFSTVKNDSRVIFC